MELLENKKNVKKAIILAGGLGTRFLPATLCLAKELFPIGNKPIIMYHLEDLKKAGISEVLIVGNKLKETDFKEFFCPSEDYIQKVESDGKLSMLEDYYNLIKDLTITYVNQDDQEFVYDGETYKNEYAGVRGSAIAIAAGKDWAKDEPFIVLNGDDLCFYEDGRAAAQDVVDTYHATGDNVVYGKKIPVESAGKYSAMVLGDAVSGNGFNVQSIIEKPTLEQVNTVVEASKGKEGLSDQEVIMSFARYILDKRFIDAISKAPARPNGEINMTDVLAYLATQGQVSTSIFGGKYFDCGSEEGYAEANLYAVKAKKKAQAAMSVSQSESSTFQK